MRTAWIPSDKFWADITPGVSVSYWKTGNNATEHTVRPTANLTTNWTPKSDISLGATLSFLSSAPRANQSGDVIVKTTELLWLSGNPHLHNSTRWFGTINSTWFTRQWLTLSLSCEYFRDNNNIFKYYTAAPAETGGLIQTSINADAVEELRIPLNISLKLLTNKLNISLTPSLVYTKAHGQYSTSESDFQFTASGNYRVGNCRFGLWYRNAYTGIGESGMLRYWHNADWYINFTYGSGDLYFSITAENLFKKRLYERQKYISPHFCSQSETIKNGRCVSVNLTYTFGYGKKVDRNIDISGPNPVKTGIVDGL